MSDIQTLKNQKKALLDELQHVSVQKNSVKAEKLEKALADIDLRINSSESAFSVNSARATPVMGGPAGDWKSFGELLKAVAGRSMNGRMDDRLSKALAESDPATGGFAIQHQVVTIKHLGCRLIPKVARDA